MRLTIASRKSDLARLQAYMVGDALKNKNPDIEIHHHFRASLGDRNQHDPLWQMPSQGVFTQDFRQDLIAAKVDMVVHSWKDLPTMDDGTTKLAATLPRADHRDLLLVRKSALEDMADTRIMRLLSSSPRRIHNAEKFLRKAIPGGLDKIEFTPVRGNIQTRLNKMLEGEEHGLIVAKAAIDRLLEADRWSRNGDSFAPAARAVRQALSRCNWMILPASWNPAAAAQGALVVEIAANRPDLEELLDKINCPDTFADVTRERAILAAHGGGCHQKIGVWVKTLETGTVTSLRGMNEKGQELNEFSLRASRRPPRADNKTRICPPSQLADLFHRRPLEPNDKARERIGRADALLLASARVPQPYLDMIGKQVIWVSGTKSWFRLAARGVWVNGSDDHLGYRFPRRIETLLGHAPQWLTLTHRTSPASPSLATYELVPDTESLELEACEFFYWRSGSAFLRALELAPRIRNKVHAAGLGRTHDILKQTLGNDAAIFTFLNEEDWLSQISPNEH